MSTASQVTKLYNTVIEDVISNVKDAFVDEGVDEQVLQELKQLWSDKLAASKALESAPIEMEMNPTHNPLMLPQPINAANTQRQNRPILVQGNQLQNSAQFRPTGATSGAGLALPTGLFQQQIAALGAGGQIQNITVQQTGNGQFIAVPGLATQQMSQFQQQVQLNQQGASRGIQPHGAKLMPGSNLVQQQQQRQNQLSQSQAAIHQNVIQLDGNGDSSSSDNEDFDDDDDKDDDKDDENDEDDQGEEEEPLNTDDDVSNEEDPTELFDTENVVVCQFDKINRNKNKWKFHLKDGIMNLDGKDFVFQKANGDSEW